MPDHMVFQRDDEYSVYQAAKREALLHKHRHVCRESFPEHDAARAIARIMAADLCETPGMPPLCIEGLPLDALALYVQEDLALHDLKRDRLVYAHVCFPSGWDPQEKIGKSFSSIHAAVPDMTRLSAAIQNLFTYLRSSPMVRFAWALSTDARLNHHPAIQREDCGAYLRVERQVTYPLEHDLMLFSIRTYINLVEELSEQQRTLLCSSVESMSPSMKAYKGITAGLLERLRAR